MVLYYHTARNCSNTHPASIITFEMPRANVCLHLVQRHYPPMILALGTTTTGTSALPTAKFPNLAALEDYGYIRDKSISALDSELMVHCSGGHFSLYRLVSPRWWLIGITSGVDTAEGQLIVMIFFCS